jgi:hypothetical protein
VDYILVRYTKEALALGADELGLMLYTFEPFDPLSGSLETPIAGARFFFSDPSEPVSEVEIVATLPDKLNRLISILDELENALHPQRGVLINSLAELVTFVQKSANQNPRNLDLVEL